MWGCGDCRRVDDDAIFNGEPSRLPNGAVGAVVAASSTRTRRSLTVRVRRPHKDTTGRSVANAKVAFERITAASQPTRGHEWRSAAATAC